MMKKIKDFVIDVEFYQKDIGFWRNYAENQPGDDEIWDEYRKSVQKMYDYKKKHKICNFVYKHFKKSLK